LAKFGLKRAFYRDRRLVQSARMFGLNYGPDKRSVDSGQGGLPGGRRSGGQHNPFDLDLLKL
jgi:hypothetical protein